MKMANRALMAQWAIDMADNIAAITKPDYYENAAELFDKTDVRDLKKIAAELLKVSWQPIASAPKDGTYVLLGGPKSIDLGNWADAKPEDRESGTIVDPGLPAGWYGYGGMWPEEEQPTHWMPLPSLP